MKNLRRIYGNLNSLGNKLAESLQKLGDHYD